MSAGVLYVNLQELEISEWLKLHGVYLILGQSLIRPDYGVAGFERLLISLWVGGGGMEIEMSMGKGGGGIDLVPVGKNVVIRY